MINLKQKFNKIILLNLIFGIVHLSTIFLALISNKFVANKFGPTGVGLNSIITYVLITFRTFLTFGISTSSIKLIKSIDINNSVNELKIINTKIKFFFLTGVLGGLFFLIFGKNLIFYFFQISVNKIELILLSLSVFFGQMAMKNNSLLLTSRNSIAYQKSIIFTNIFNIFILFFVFEIFKKHTIVIYIFLAILFSYIISYFYAKKVIFKIINISFQDFITNLRPLFLIGLIITSSHFITQIFNLYLRSIISKEIGLDGLGFYTAGFSIVNGYSGAMLALLTADFFPKLSSSISDNKKLNKLLNLQFISSNYIICILSFFILIFIHEIIIISYSINFLKIDKLISYAVIGVFFKIYCWILSLYLLAKGNDYIYFFTELINNVLILIFSILLLKLLGIDGFGLAFALSYFFSFLLLIYVVRIKHQYKIPLSAISMFSIQIIFIAAVSFVMNESNQQIKYIAIPLITILNICYIINKNISLINYLKKNNKK